MTLLPDHLDGLVDEQVVEHLVFYIRQWDIEGHPRLVATHMEVPDRGGADGRLHVEGRGGAQPGLVLQIDVRRPLVAADTG